MFFVNHYVPIWLKKQSTIKKWMRTSVNQSELLNLFGQPHQWPLQLENCCCMSLKLIKPKGGLFLKSTSCNRIIMCTFCQHLWSRVASIISTTKCWVAKSSSRCFLIVLSRYFLNFISNDLTWNRWRDIWAVYSKLSCYDIYGFSCWFKG